MSNKISKIINILFYISIIYNINQIIKKNNTFNNIKEFHNIIKSNESNAIFEDSILVENIRSNVIRNIEESYIFNNINRDFILDSLKNIKIKFIDTHNYTLTDSTTASFFRMRLIEELINDTYHFRKLTPSNYDNIIIVDIKYLNDKELRDRYLYDIITHELYHYVDLLYGDNNLYYHSKDLELSEFVDREIFDNREYVNLKILKICGYIPYMVSEVNDISIFPTFRISGNFEYLSQNIELFARWMTFKSKLVKQKYIDNINSDIDVYIILDYTRDIEVDIFDMELLLTLDLDKIEELNNILK